MVGGTRMNAVVELRDAAMQLLKERGKEEIFQGTPRIKVDIEDLEMASWTPAIDTTAVEIWAPNKVLNVWTTGSGEVTIVGFRRGAWEARLLSLAGYGRGLKPLH